MKCPKCQGDLKCEVSIRTELEDRPIQISYQWWRCKACPARFTAILEDSKVNMFDDRLEHQGYLVEESVWQSGLEWARGCPDESSESCKCAVHKGVPPAGFHGSSAWYTYE